MNSINKFHETSFLENFHQIDDTLKKKPLPISTNKEESGQGLKKIEKALEDNLTFNPEEDSIKASRSVKKESKEILRDESVYKNRWAQKEKLKQVRQLEEKIERQQRRKIFFKLGGLLMIVGMILAMFLNPFASRNNSPSHLYNRASEYHSNQKYEKAIEQYQNFLDKFPQNELADDAQYYIAGCLDLLGEFDRAVQKYQKVIDNYPQQDKAGWAQYWIGRIYMKQGLLNKAVEEFQKAIFNYAEEAFVLDCFRKIGESYKLQDNPLQAVEVYQKALNVQGNISQYYDYYQMGICYEQLGDWGTAKIMYQKVIADNSSDNKWIQKAENRINQLGISDQKEKSWKKRK